MKPKRGPKQWNLGADMARETLPMCPRDILILMPGNCIPRPELVTRVVDPEEVPDEDVPLLPPLSPVHEVVEVSA